MTENTSTQKRVFLCVLSALLVCLSFPSFLDKNLNPWGAPLIWIALIPFFLSLREVTPKTGAFLGLVFGFLYLGGVLYWIALLEEAKYLSGLAWLVLVFYLSLYFAAFGWAYCFLRDRLKTAGIFLAPIIWVGLEYIRGTRPWGGFPWGQVGYAAAPYPSVLYLTSFTGIYGLTFLMVWVNASFAHGWSLWKKRTGLSGKSFFLTFEGSYFWFPVTVVALVWFVGTIEVRGPVRDAGPVAILQPSIDQSVKWDKAYEKKTYDILESLIRRIKPGEPRLVLWPEAAAPDFLFYAPQAYARVASMVRTTAVPNLVGSLEAMTAPDKRPLYYNAAIHFDPTGHHDGIYRKIHLVPFGEFVPFQKYISFLGPVINDLGQLERGQAYSRMRALGFTYSPMICYEVIFPEEARDALQNGADALVNISNDSWYGNTASPYQHALMAVVRAAENHRPLLRASNAGICLTTDPFGRVLGSSKLFERTLFTSEVLLSAGTKTLYLRWGSWLPKICWLLMCLIAIVAVRKNHPTISNPEEKVSVPVLQDPPFHP